MDNDVFPIIVPLYKIELYIDECVNSVIDLICKKCKLLLTYDWNTDNLGGICDEWLRYELRITIFIK